MADQKNERSLFGDAEEWLTVACEKFERATKRRSLDEVPIENIAKAMDRAEKQKVSIYFNDECSTEQIKETLNLFNQINAEKITTSNIVIGYRFQLDQFNKVVKGKNTPPIRPKSPPVFSKEFQQ